MQFRDPENPPLFRPVTYNVINTAETSIEIHNNSRSEVRVIKMNTSADGIVEFEIQEGDEMPFKYTN